MLAILLSLLSIPIILVAASKAVEKVKSSGSFELDESLSNDPRFFRFMETLGSILSIKQEPNFNRALTLAVIIIASIVVMWSPT